MKEHKLLNAIEIPSIDKVSLKDEDENLIETPNDNSINTNIGSLISDRKEGIRDIIIKALKNSPLIVPFFYITLIFAFTISLIYTIFYFVSKPNFKIVDLDWIVSDKNDRKYQDYFFDNGLEVLLVQDKLFDRDGVSIVIENGYMEYPKEEGIATFATYLLNAITTYDEPKIYKNFNDYFGIYDFGIDENFIHFSFEILNNGFKKFFYYFSNILNPTSISAKYDEYKDYIIESIDNLYKTRLNDISNKESHLIDYLVYNLKDDNNEDILPEGNRAGP